MNIEIKNGLAEVSYKKSSKNHSKVITISSLVEALNANQGISTPVLPFGCRSYIRKGNSHRFLIELSPMRRFIRYINKSGKTIFEDSVPMPWGVMAVELRENSSGTYTLNTGTTAIRALSRPIFSFDDDIYHYPVPNVYADHGNICWGGSLKQEDKIIENLAMAGKFVDIFIGSNFNADIAPRFNMYTRYEDLLRAIQKRNTFPDNVLVKKGSLRELIGG